MTVRALPAQSKAGTAAGGGAGGAVPPAPPGTAGGAPPGPAGGTPAGAPPGPPPAGPEGPGTAGGTDWEVCPAGYWDPPSLLPYGSEMVDGSMPLYAPPCPETEGMGYLGLYPELIPSE